MNPRTSSFRKHVRGTIRQDRLPAHIELRRPESVPRPPQRLGNAARKEWSRVAKALWESNSLAVVDLALLENYCRLVGMVIELDDQLHRDGYTVQSARSAPRSHPAFRMLLQIAPQLKNFADALGIGAKARGQIDPLPQPAEGDDDDERFFKPRPPARS